jgi:signal transduction histidine kinase/ActR/RegA family two-component response regulator
VRNPLSSYQATGRQLAWRLFGLSVVCWWVLGLAFSGLWWLTNHLQLEWILFCYAWEVPVIGWTGAVFFPLLRWRAVGRLIDETAPSAVRALVGYPRFVARCAFLTSSAGYGLGALQLVIMAHLPALEACKIAIQGPVLGAVLSAAGFLVAERATRSIVLPDALRPMAASDAARVRVSVGRKIRFITVAIALGAATPIFLFGISREQRRLEQLRGIALEQELSARVTNPVPLAPGLVEPIRRLGGETALYVLDDDSAGGAGRVPGGVPIPFTHQRESAFRVGPMHLDAPPRLYWDPAGWFASRFDGHRVVAFRRVPSARGQLLVVAVSPLADYGRELIGAALETGGVLVVALLVATLLSVAFARSLVDPLRRLRGAATEMADGKRDVATAIAVGGDEVAALTYQFDAMALRVRSDEADLRAAYEELALAQQQLVQAEKLSAVGQVVSGIAHELNNPLAAILHFADNLLADAGHSAADREMLQLVATQARRARAIVRDLLSFVRAREYRQQAADVGDIIRHTAETVAPAVAETGARLRVTVRDDLPLVRVDPVGIEQVLTNLVVNGAQAAGAAGSVAMTLVPADGGAGGVRVLVDDSGPGIAPSVMPHIFEPFFTTKGPGKGTGLGLSVSLGIVQQHSGKLWAENLPADLGGGARFALDLPAHPDQAAAAAELHARAVREAADRARTTNGASNGAVNNGSMSRHKKTVLIVDDERPIRMALRRFLERSGWLVEEADTGRVALRRLLDSPDGHYHAVITDLMMPDLTGIEVYDQLAVARPDLLPRLIISTGDISSEAVASFRSRATGPFLEKPFELAALADLLDRMT